MNSLERTDTSAIGRWWWTVDRWTLLTLLALMAFGAILCMAASPSVAARLNLDSFYFVRRQITLLPLALVTVLVISLLPPRMIRRLCLIGFAGALAMTAATLAIGVEINGARRWLNLFGLSIQPSEFLKPFFIVTTAWLFSRQNQPGAQQRKLIAIGLFAIVGLLLLRQPDVGMALLVACIWFGQFFLAGLSTIWIGVFGLMGVMALTVAYFSFGHVASRINRFFDPSSGDSYQVEQSLKAFANGGLFGTGPGEGTVKARLPDSHADFVFAVAGEELGLFACLLIVALFGIIVLRSLIRAREANSLFVILAGGGLAALFGMQALINMGSTLRLVPTKGMTLPFISYGGSSLLAVAITVGLMLALTRRRRTLE